MPFMTWNDRFATGIAQVDTEHQEIIALINRLHDAVTSGSENQASIVLLESLAEYTSKHFDLEEGLMDSAGYPGLSEHKHQHHLARNAILRFRNDHLDGRKVLSGDVLEFLRTWLTDHILGTDLQYVEFFKARGVVG
jgi:hemerythrin